MNRALFAHTLRANRSRLLVVSLAFLGWGALLPVIYDAFGAQFAEMRDLLPPELTRFGGGDVFSLVGSVALGAIHPLAVGMGLVFAVGFSVTAIAGERQRGTLEVLLARPISRRTVYATLAIAAALFIGITTLAMVVGTWLGASATGTLGELGAGNLPILWLNMVLLYGAIAAVTLAASVSFDRLSPAIAVSLTFVLVSYFLETIGELWPDAAGLQPYSVFHYLDARNALTGLPDPADFLTLAGVVVVAVAYALIVFPRRDLAAPS